jgi:hypothetical protein
MATTTNYSWTTPDDTALVKDGAAAIRSLGTAIDTTVFTNAGAAIAKTIVDAKGDIIAATAADTVSRLAVGANDTVLTADSSEATGLKWAAPVSGGMTLLASGALSSTSTTYNVVTTGYTYLQIFMNNVYATADNVISMRINGDTGSNYASVGFTSGPTDNKLNAQTSYRITAGTGTTNQIINNANAFIQIFDPNSTSQMAISHQAMCGPSGDMRFNVANGNYDCAAAITSILFLHASGSFSSGTVSIYGVK